MKMKLKLKVNGAELEAFIEPHTTLQDLLREDLDFTGTKEGCSSGMCGACTVLVDGKAVKSCLIIALQCQGKEITTIEGLARGEQLHPLQTSFIEHGAIQCGFCTPGMVLTAKSWLDENPNPSEEDVRLGISGNLCRCTGYVKIVDAIMATVAKNK